MEIFWKRAELVKLFGVQARTITDWVQRGLPNNGKQGAAVRYPATDVIAWVIEYRIQQALKQKSVATSTELGNIPPIAVSEAIEKHWRAQRERQRTLREAGELVTVEDAQKELNHHVTQIRNSLDSIPFSWSPYLVMLPDVEAAQRQLDELLDVLYAALSSLPDADEDTAIETEETQNEDGDDG